MLESCDQYHYKERMEMRRTIYSISLQASVLRLAVMLLEKQHVSHDSQSSHHIYEAQ